MKSFRPRQVAPDLGVSPSDRRHGGTRAIRLLRQALLLVATIVLSSNVAQANLSYTCDASVDATQAGTCAYLNTTIAGLYNNTFNNINANIYIQFGTTGLGASTTGFYNTVPYSTYRNALLANASDSIQTQAAASLPASEPAFYSGGDIELTSALATALNITIPVFGNTGTTSGGSSCAVGSSGCYNGIITVTTPANLSAESGGSQSLWFRTGSQPGSAYDYYSVVEHETNEVLGTASCVSTTGSSLVNGCAGNAGAAAVDLFRCGASASPVFIDATPGAYFSYNGCGTNGANGAIYNTLSNGDDYADYTQGCTFVQDAIGCLGQSFDITSDNGAETNILNAIGYNENVPEPISLAMLLPGVVGLIGARRRRKSNVS